MIETMLDVISLYSRSIIGSLIVGAVCPLLGVFFVLRRMVFLGVAVPQFAAAGVAFGFLVLHAWNCLWIEEGHHADSEGGFCFHLFFAMLFTFAALFVLVLLGRRGEGSPEGRIAAGYSLAAAVTILFLAGAAVGTSHIDVLLKGEILAISEEGILAIVLFFGLALILIFLFRRDFLLISFDREAAVSLGKKVLFWDILLYLLLGAAISVGVLTVGPLVVFGLMVIPPIAARRIACNMVSFYLYSSLFGFLAALFGFVFSYLLNWPLGPTDVVTAFAILVIVSIGRAVWRLLGRKQA